MDCTDGIKLYVASYEWCLGEHCSVDFTADLFLDVYQDNTGTIKLIQENKVGAYHVMMIDIYDKARYIYSMIYIFQCSDSDGKSTNGKCCFGSLDCRTQL